jgi:hypothetical protein
MHEAKNEIFNDSGIARVKARSSVVAVGDSPLPRQHAPANGAQYIEEYATRNLYVEAQNLHFSVRSTQERFLINFKVV